MLAIYDKSTILNGEKPRSGTRSGTREEHLLSLSFYRVLDVLTKAIK
jgi:hypothetical protein